MHRREFIRTTGTVIAGASLATNAIGYSDDDAKAAGRMVLPINRNWRYNPAVVTGGHETNFDDSAFQQVVIPHTNKMLPWHGFDEKSYQFVSLYRRRFKLPAGAQGKKVFVDFEGVMTASTVWINGVRLGEYKGGYTPFSFELTRHLDYAGENVLAVDVDSTERADIPPFGNQIDYLTFGGIYREVALRIVAATYIENIFAKPQDVLAAHPKVEVECHIRRTEDAKVPLALHVELLDGEQRCGESDPKADGISGRGGADGVSGCVERIGRDQAVGPRHSQFVHRSSELNEREQCGGSRFEADWFSGSAIHG